MMHAPKHLYISGSERAGDVVVWADCLHTGPVPAGLSLEEMSRLRARFAADFLEGRSFEAVLAQFNERDERLKHFKRFDEVTLWFGQGLDEQLRMLQILTWFAQRELGKTRLSLICGPDHLTADQRREVTPDQLELAKRAWNAFCADKPLELSELVREDLSPLPYLRAALLRQLEQFPSTRDGLSRAEQQILRAVSEGPTTLEAAYRSSQIEMEDAPFMAQPTFLYDIKRLCSGKPNLVEFVDGPALCDEHGPPYDKAVWERSLQLTDIGRKILTGQADSVRLYGIDRWLGGVRLHGAHAEWRWDGRRAVIVALSA